MWSRRLIGIILLVVLASGCAEDGVDGQGIEQGQGQTPPTQNQPPAQNQPPIQTQPPVQNTTNSYPLHKDVSVTFFWVGEAGSAANSNIPNSQSAWDDKWAQHFGGVDDPINRNGFNPATFVPSENPFYFALPYNDFDANGNRKKSLSSTIYWSGEKQWGAQESMCKNRWIQIIKGDKIAYAQWEDVGPYNEDDSAYVFGDKAPLNKINNNAGLDVSPAVRDYLGLSDIDIVDWQFVDADQVPDGPWKIVVTSSQITWN